MENLCKGAVCAKKSLLPWLWIQGTPNVVSLAALDAVDQNAAPLGRVSSGWIGDTKVAGSIELLEQPMLDNSKKFSFRLSFM